MKNTPTEEEIIAWEGEWNRREQFLLDHGWKKVEKTFKNPWNGQEYTASAWHDPVRNAVHPYADAYDQLTMIILKEDGWRAILEVKHLGTKELGPKFPKREEWGRFQSPRTKRIYSFLEAQHIMERGWKEGIYPADCSENTRQLNRLAGENFQGDIIETWYYRRKNGECIHKLWENGND